MINIYTDEKFCSNILIENNDRHFNLNVSKEYLDEFCRTLLKDVDDVTILDERSLALETRFGVAAIRNISTGVKILINIHNLVKQGKEGIVDVREMGTNLTLRLFKLLDNTGLGAYTGNYNITGMLDGEGSFRVNEEYLCNNIEELRSKLMELRWGD